MNFKIFLVEIGDFFQLCHKVSVFGLPIELAANFGSVESVTPIVARAVGHKFN